MCGRVTAQTGSEVYGMRCASCHGQDGSGKTNAAKTFNGMPDLRSQAVQTLSNKELFDRIARGLDHKKYPHVFLQTGLTQTDVAGVVDHLRALAKK
jgi:mono/diheme cytochrome c family protein